MACLARTGLSLRRRKWSCLSPSISHYSNTHWFSQCYRYLLPCNNYVYIQQCANSKQFIDTYACACVQHLCGTHVTHTHVSLRTRNHYPDIWFVNTRVLLVVHMYIHTYAHNVKIDAFFSKHSNLRTHLKLVPDDTSIRTIWSYVIKFKLNKKSMNGSGPLDGQPPGTKVNCVTAVAVYRRKWCDIYVHACVHTYIRTCYRPPKLPLTAHDVVSLIETRDPPHAIFLD